MTLKAPILFDVVFDFVKDIPEAVEVLSKKYQISLDIPLNCKESIMIRANQYYVFETIYENNSIEK